MLRKLSTLMLLAFAVSCSKGEARAAEQPAVAADTGGPAAKAAPGARAEGQGFVVEVEPPAQVKVGEQARARVVLKPTGPYHVNLEFPTQLTVKPPAGVELAKAKQKPEDAAKFAEEGAVFEVAFTPKEPGDKSFEAAFKFAVCTTETCDPKSEKLAWTVAVK